MTDACSVREVRWNDFDDLVQNYYECYDDREKGEFTGITLFAQRPSKLDEADWFARMYRRVQEGGEIALVAECDGVAVAYCGVTPRGPPTHETGHIGDLGILVRRSYRGKRVGEVLMRHVLDRCRGRLEVVFLSVFSVNEPAKQLYRKLGFQLVGTLPHEVKRGGQYYDGDLMYLLLDPKGARPSGAAEPPVPTSSPRQS